MHTDGPLRFIGISEFVHGPKPKFHQSWAITLGLAINCWRLLRGGSSTDKHRARAPLPRVHPSTSSQKKMNLSSSSRFHPPPTTDSLRGPLHTTRPRTFPRQHRLRRPRTPPSSPTPLPPLFIRPNLQERPHPRPHRQLPPGRRHLQC